MHGTNVKKYIILKIVVTLVSRGTLKF